jgi:CBS domain-containing protein
MQTIYKEKRMQIKENYTKNVQYVSPDTPLTNVAKLMEEHDCGSILVGENEKLAGVITDRDIVVRCVAKDKAPAEMTAGECKTPKILYCFETDEAEEVLKNMAENKVRRMPVLDNEQNKRLVGVISFGDLSAICENKQASGEAMEKIREY